MAHAAQILTNFGHELRACLRCRLIKTYDQFRESGCENCPFFKMDQDHELVVDCTTPNFTGLILVMDPTRSWAARWLRIDFLSSDVMHGEGNLLAHLVIIGYKVFYEQSPLIEYDFRVTNLFEDLQDGVRLCRAIH